MATKIIQGEDREISFGLKDTNEEVFIDLTNATAISLKISATAGGATEFTLDNEEIVITEPLKGKFKAIISDAKSALLKVGVQNLEVVIDIGEERRIVQLPAGIEVVKRLF